MTLPRFRTIMADPPWPEHGGCGRGADAHYDTVPVHQIPAVMRSSPLWRPDTQCHLWLWATIMHLPDAMHLLPALGFRYTSHLVWGKFRAGKVQQGLGRYVRGSHELVILGSRGASRVPPQAQPSLVLAERTKHSAKPEAVVQAIERISPGPRAELFGRKPRDRWFVWGNELTFWRDCVAPPDDLDIPAPGPAPLLDFADGGC